MSGPLKQCCDIGGLMVALGTIAGYIPLVAGTLLSILGCIHYGLQIYDWIKNRT